MYFSYSIFIYFSSMEYLLAWIVTTTDKYINIYIIHMSIKLISTTIAGRLVIP